MGGAILGFAIFLKQEVQLGNTQTVAEQTSEISKQTMQISTETKALIDETKHIALAVQSREEVRRRVVSFFAGASGEAFTCIVPSTRRGKPFPAIELGDHHVLELLNRALSTQKILPLLVPRGAQVNAPERTLFVCSPKANGALRHVYGFEPMR